MDGTLVDTLKITMVSLSTVCPRLGLDVPTEETVRSLIGLADEQFYGAMYPGITEDTLRRLARQVEVREAEAAEALGEGVLFPGVLEMLEQLGLDGVPLFLASTGSPFHVDTTLDAFGGKRFFQEINCGEADKVDMTARILKRYGSPMIFVGDTAKDIEAARGNDLPVVGAGYGYVAAEHRVLFDRVFDSAQDLCAYLLSMTCYNS
ncbi:MAG: HAD family hydrolase [Clostridiales bacterium]|nr:HAD family hydrolase [Clostridiales bacterium]